MKKVLTIVIVVAALQIGLVSAADASGGKYHKVYYGETLYSIGRLYDVAPHYLSEVNGLYNPNYIYAGQVLYIPDDGPPYPWYGHKGYGNDGYGNKPAKCQYDCGSDYNQGGGQGWNDCSQSNCGGYGQQGNMGRGQQGKMGYDQQGKQNMGYDQQGHQNMGYDQQGQQGNMGRGQQGNMGYGQQGKQGNMGGGQGWNNNCGQSKCGSSYGYDYTGYYYGGQGKQYSFTCGYYSNCW